MVVLSYLRPSWSTKVRQPPIFIFSRFCWLLFRSPWASLIPSSQRQDLHHAHPPPWPSKEITQGAHVWARRFPLSDPSGFTSSSPSFQPIHLQFPNSASNHNSSDFKLEAKSMMGRALPFSVQNVRVEEGKSVATHLPLLSPQPSALAHTLSKLTWWNFLPS